MSVEERARAVLESRLASVRALGEVAERIAKLQEQLQATEAELVRAYRVATRDGWTEADLRGFGFSEPARRRRASSRKPSGE